MTPRERTIKTFNFEEVHPVPYSIWYDREVKEKLDKYYGSSLWQNSIHDHIRRLTVCWEPRNYIDENHFKDIHGSIWRKGNPPHVSEPALKESSLNGFNIPSYVPFIKNSKPADSKEWPGYMPFLSFEDARKLIEAEKNETFTVVGYGYGFFEGAWMSRGMENFMTDLLLEPKFAEGLLDMILERHLETIDLLATLPCDGIIHAEDYGDQMGIIIGPDLWRKFIKPRLAKIYDRIHSAGKMSFQHSCGNIYPIAGDLIDIGLDVLQSLQAEAMDIYKLKKEYGKHLRLWGGLGTQQILPFGSLDDVRTEIRKLKSELGRGGGYVLSSSKPIMKDVPVENAVAFIEETIAE